MESKRFCSIMGGGGVSINEKDEVNVYSLSLQNISFATVDTSLGIRNQIKEHPFSPMILQSPVSSLSTSFLGSYMLPSTSKSDSLNLLIVNKFKCCSLHQADRQSKKENCKINITKRKQLEVTNNNQKREITSLNWFQHLKKKSNCKTALITKIVYAHGVVQATAGSLPTDR